MDIFQKLIEVFIGQDFSVILGVISVLVSYLAYNQRQANQKLEEYHANLVKKLSEARCCQSVTQKELQDLRQLLKEDIIPMLRKMDADVKDLERLQRLVEEAKVDQKDWFNALHDDFNQFRSEFRDILKLVLNGRKLDH